MNKPLAFAAIAEAVTGAALLLAPSLVARLLFGAELSGVALIVARVTGISLISLGVACWPGKSPIRMALRGMTIYSLIVTLYFLYLCIPGEFRGPLLWLAAALHAALTLLLGRSWLNATNADNSG